MRVVTLCALALSLALAATLASAGGGGGGDHSDIDESDVLVLGNDDFDDNVKGEELMLVEFYAPWCGHCKHLAPEFAKAAKDLKKDGVKLAKIDATVHGALASKYKVSGYPKLFVFRNGRESDYNGPREHKGIVEYMRKQVGPAAKPLASLSDFQAFTKLDAADRDYVVVGFFNSANAKSQLQSSFMLVSSRMRDDFFFAVCSDAAVIKAAGELHGIDLLSDKEGAVVAFKAYDDKRTAYSGSTKTQNVQDWIQSQSLPLVGDFTKERAARYQKRALPVAKYYTKIDRSKGNAKQMTYILNRLEPLAKEYAGQLVVALASPTDWPQDMSELGWASKSEGFVIVNADGKRKYRFEQKFTAENLKKFAASYLAGKAEVWVKSEEVPATNDGPVKVVVGKTFDAIVNDPTRDVLIEFYAPWCGHCKTLAPKYDKLGKKFKDVDSVVIAKIDATANDYSADYSVSGFPTVFFKPAGGKPKLYEGEREVTNFVSFIKKHSKTKWSFRK